MIVGIDFDNTLVNYADLFYREAQKRGLLPPGVASDRQSVRDALRSLGKEADFTLLQGQIYGPGIFEAEPYPKAIETVTRLRDAGWQIHVISHKTRKPYLGPAHNLHQFAIAWLEAKGFFAPGLLERQDVFMEESLVAKLARVETQKCACFIDDLPEVLLHPAFPETVARILFDPAGKHCGSEKAVHSFTSWPEIGQYLAGASHA